MRRYLAYAFVSTFFIVPGYGLAQPATPQEQPKVIPGGIGGAADFLGAGEKKGEPKKGKEPAEVKEATLEQLIAEALKNNPDIRVADAKVREVEAEANRIRLKVISDLSVLHGEISGLRESLLEAELRLKRATVLRRTNAIQEDEYGAVLLAVIKLKGELTVKSAALPYLLGKPPVGMDTPLQAQLHSYKAMQFLGLLEKAGVAAKALASDDEWLQRVTQDVQGRLPTAAEKEKFAKSPGPDRRKAWIEVMLKSEEVAKHHDRMDDSYLLSRLVQFSIKLDPSTAEKLRKALDGPITLRAGEFAQGEIMDHVREHLKGVNLHVRVKSAKVVDVQINEPIPLGAFLQLVEEELSCVFVLREYGIVASSSEDRLPPGAVRVIEYWKQVKSTETKGQK